MGTVAVTIEVDSAMVGRYGDGYLAMLWHVAQANPAPHGDRSAGELAERIGREIIRRWLTATAPELWRHQGQDYYWEQLRRLATYQPDDGVWVARPPAAGGEPTETTTGPATEVGPDGGDGR